MSVKDAFKASYSFSVLPQLAELGLYFTVAVLPLFPFRYIILLFGFTAFSFIVRKIVKKDFGLIKIPIRYSIFLYLLPIFFASFSSIALNQGLIRLIVYIIAFVFLLMSVNLIDSKEKLYKLLVSLVLAATIVGLYGLYQYRVGTQLDESWIDISLNPDIETRVISTFDNPNILAEYLILTIPITFCLFYNSRGFIKKVLFFISGITQVLCILFTYSRGGWLGLFLAILIFAIFVDRRLLLLYVIGGIGLMLLNPQAIITRITTIVSMEDTSNLYRIRLWKSTINMIKDFWLNGVGLGIEAFKRVHLHYIIAGEVAAHAHNVYLQIFAESGVFGILGFFVFIFNSLKLNLISIVKGMDEDVKRVSAAVFASVIGILLHGLVDHIFFSEKIIIMFWLLIAVGIIGNTLEFNHKKR